MNMLRFISKENNIRKLKQNVKYAMKSYYKDNKLKMVKNMIKNAN